MRAVTILEPGTQAYSAAGWKAGEVNRHSAWYTSPYP